MTEFKEFKVAKIVEDRKRIDARNIRYMMADLFLDYVRTTLYKIRLYKAGIINRRQLFKLVSKDYFLFNEDDLYRISVIEFGGSEAAACFRAARECVAHGAFDTDDPKVLEDCIVQAICILEKFAHI